MLDFLYFIERPYKQGNGVDIVPAWRNRKSKDLMIRGNRFYAVYNEATGLWMTDDDDVIDIMDHELDMYKAQNLDRLTAKYGDNIRLLYLSHSEYNSITDWREYCKFKAPNNFVTLDQHVIFANAETTREDYASKKLPYALGEGDFEAYDRIISTLYSPENRHKIEWAIGCIVAGMVSKHHKFLVLYGDPGTGKSTVINIIDDLFKGYTTVFDAKALGNANKDFAMETFREDPIVAFQHDGDLSRIEDNTRLNSLVAHEKIVMNNKNQNQYVSNFNAFLFIATNKPVKITDAKSGIIRRLIEVTPTGEKIPKKEFDILKVRYKYELGAIAYHCLGVYKADPDYYDNYIPTNMMSATNDFYNFMEDRYFDYVNEDGITGEAAYEQYKAFCDRTGVQYPAPYRVFKEELKSYFREFHDRIMIDGMRYRSYYKGFRKDRFISSDTCAEKVDPGLEKVLESPPWLKFNLRSSLLDIFLGDQQAQYEVDYGAGGQPERKWSECTTTLSDINTSKTHYVRVPGDMIVIDFDIPDENGNKSFELNYEAAKKWPPTYAELSKSGEGIHLHYIYTGDINDLAPKISEHVEVKVFPSNKKSALRRRVSQCNDIQIATLSSGLPLKGVNNVVKPDILLDEARLRRIISNALEKKYGSKSTTDNIDYIFHNLEDAYNSGIYYDVENLHQIVLDFAMGSTNQAKKCIQTVGKMHFRSKDAEEAAKNVAESVDATRIGFFDIEVFCNHLIVCWVLDPLDIDWTSVKQEDYKDIVERLRKECVMWVDPTPDQLEMMFTQHLMVGYNNLRYDNPICYERIVGSDIFGLYNLSKTIINSKSYIPNGAAKHLSYTDAYDFLSSGNKKSLKAHEIELGIPHQELDHDWDAPIEDKDIPIAGAYCINDVLATMIVFHHYHSDFMARVILAKLAGGTPNNTTNQLTEKFIFGDDRNPQSQFQWRDMGDVSKIDIEVTKEKVKNLDLAYPEFTVFDALGKPIFPGYRYEYGKSYYREFNPDNPIKDDQTIGEGGLAWSIPGYYTELALKDVEGMHPSGAIADNLFGSKYTKRYEDLKKARMAIKHEDWDEARALLNGQLCPFIDMINRGEITVDDLSAALKTAINSVYGLTAAAFKNPFKDPKNIDNYVAKRGALFMVNLKHEIEAKGYIVAHIKTDSVKIPNATPEILKFIDDYGALYGYVFDHEATYDKMVIINRSVYIAKYASIDKCNNLYGYCPKDNKKHPGEWTATGKEFQIPYIFKTLFSKEPITLKDLSITFSVSTTLYLDMNEGMEADEHNYQFVGKVGQLTPVRSGLQGGYLMRKATDKEGNTTYGYANGAKGYRWVETSQMEGLTKIFSTGENGVFDIVDITYFDKLRDDAIADIEKYVDINTFTE